MFAEKEIYGPKQTVSCWAVKRQIIPHIKANIYHFLNSVNKKKIIQE